MKPGQRPGSCVPWRYRQVNAASLASPPVSSDQLRDIVVYFFVAGNTWNKKNSIHINGLLYFFGWQKEAQSSISARRFWRRLPRR